MQPFFRVLILLSYGFLTIQADTSALKISIGDIVNDVLGKLKPKGVRVEGDCSFLMSGGLTEPQPLFVNFNTTDFLLPSPDGVVQIANGQLVDMYCTNSFVEPFVNTTKITAQCLQGSYYLVDGLIREFRNFSCTGWATFTARRTGKVCNGGTTLIEVGFEVAGDNFIQVMDVCHDEEREVTRYVHHKLNPSSAAYQRSVTRPSFITGEFYNGKDVNGLYTKVQQKATFDIILGEDTSKYFNDSSDIYLARGHMSAKVDHIYGTAQKATFFFVNAAPQWQKFNAGNWERVEDGVRKFVSNQGIEVDCYTGIWGVSTLPDVNGTHQELYLDFDENNNGLIPVPKVYFRVVIEPATKRGIVLVGVNNPHVTLEQILQEYVVCDDVSDFVTWINWKKDDILQGYMYACEVNQFREVVTDLPEFDVEGLLY